MFVIELIVKRLAACRRLWAALPIPLLLGAVLSVPARGEPIYLIDRGGYFISIEPYAPNILRVTVSNQASAASAKPGFGFLAEPDDADWSRERTSTADVFKSSALIATVSAGATAPQAPATYAEEPSGFEVSIKNASGQTLARMIKWEMGPHLVQNEATYKVSATFAAPANEHYFGLGQHQEGDLDLRGHSFDCRHDYLPAVGETVCVPFVVTNKGYAIVWDNPSTTRASFAFNERTTWESQVGDRISFFVIAGHSTDELYAGYRKLTGITPIPPKAAFGFIQSKNRYGSQAELLSAAEGYRQRGYPADMMVVDWFYWTKMGQFDFDLSSWPDPSAMNDRLHALGFQSMISVWPRFQAGSRFYDELAAKGLLMKNASGEPTYGLSMSGDTHGALIDSTNPAARAFYWDHIRDDILSRKFDAVWLDETEPDLVPDSSFFSVGSGSRYHNLFPLLHTQGVYEGMRRDQPNRRGLILSRAAYLGAQRNGALFWSSDIFPTWDTLRRQVPTGLGFTASGLAYWGDDIGGWRRLPQTHHPVGRALLDPSDARDVVGGYDDYPELFTRWFEFGTFTPTMRVHGTRSQTEIWAYGRAAEPILAKYLRLRYALMPYIYSLGRRVYETGAPFMRALFMDFPNDERALAVSDEYMFGPAFLVAPITDQGKVTRDIYLPAGSDWYDYWTEKRYRGGQMISVRAPIDTIPLFVRAGSIIPLGESVQSTATLQKLAAVRVYRGADGDFNLYSDDGLTYAYETRDGYSSTHMHWDDTLGVLKVSGDPSPAGDPARLLQIVWTKPSI